MPAIDRNDRAAYGKYLAETVAHCMQCHSPKKDNLPDLARAGAGGSSYTAPGGGSVIAPNLTPANTEGIAKWSDAQIKTTVTKGVRPDGGRIVGVMDFELYEHMTDADLDLIVGYLRALKPVETPK